jgi:uncharacterized DUF497 family protein
MAIFEFDENKSQKNSQKHGISFHEARKLWLNDVLTLKAKSVSENRLLVIGVIDYKFWTAIVTVRKVHCIRIISVRRSRDEEKELYKKEKNNG